MAGEGGLDLRDQRRRRPSPLATAAAAAAAFSKSGAGGRCFREEDFCRRMGQIEYLRATVESYPRRLRSVIAAKKDRI
uniref:Uncharacterized protein n=1 Tax=Caenorhabditis japonica TaxID=281687 RepID=A0A8R1EHA8_CAEJA